MLLPRQKVVRIWQYMLCFVLTRHQGVDLSTRWNICPGKLRFDCDYCAVTLRIAVFFTLFPDPTGLIQDYEEVDQLLSFIFLLMLDLSGCTKELIDHLRVILLRRCLFFYWKIVSRILDFWIITAQHSNKLPLRVWLIAMQPRGLMLGPLR